MDQSTKALLRVKVLPSCLYLALQHALRFSKYTPLVRLQQESTFPVAGTPVALKRQASWRVVPFLALKPRQQRWMTRLLLCRLRMLLVSDRLTKKGSACRYSHRCREQACLYPLWL